MTAASIFDSLSPTDLGLPPKFDRFRTAQKQALDWLSNDCTQPISAACLPTGSGKTLIPIALARLLNKKTVYLVATKALQAQVHSEFASVGMVDIRGRANYGCMNYGNCEAGEQESCSLYNTNACPYTRAVERAKDSDLVVTNYAYWLHARKHNPKALERDFRPVELLICDEAHALESQLGGFASVKIYASELRGLKDRPLSGVMDNALAPTPGHPSGPIFEWAHKQIVRLKDTTDEDEQDLLDRFKRIVRMSSNWVWQFDSYGHVTFEPIRLSSFTSPLLSGVPRVLLMSASLNEFTLKLVLPSDAEYDYRSWPSVFPPQNAPVYHIPTRKLNWKSTDEDYKAIIETADRIMSERRDRKGIIHTVSYTRSKQTLQHSSFRERFIWNDIGDVLPDRLAAFRQADAGAVLVTPSVSAGFDFPLDQCEYQIILKFPFPNETQKVIAERCKQIHGYRLHSAAQSFVQMCGRPVRSELDKAETFCLDNSVRQLCGPEGKSYCPPGFRIFTVAQIPKAPPKIGSS